MAEEQQVFYVEVGQDLTQGVGDWKEMNRSELEDFYNDSPILKKQFGDFNTYASYMGELTALYDDGTLVKTWGEEYQAQNPYDAEGNLKPGANPLEIPYTYVDNNLSEAVVDLNEKYGLTGPRQDTGTYQPIYDESGDAYQWNGTSYTRVFEKPEDSLWDQVFKAGVLGTLAVAFGGAAKGALGGALGGIGSGAAGGAVGSAVSGAITGDITAEGILQGALLGGIGGLADKMLAGELVGSRLDEAVWELSDVLGMDYDQTLNILEGVASGAITGEGLEGIVTGVVTNVGADKLTSYIEDSVGLDVPNLFEEGTTTINRDAVEEASRVLLRDALEGELDSGTLASMGIGYIREDGTFAFMDPSSLIPDIDTGKVGDFFDFLPDIELMGGEGFDIDIDTDEARMEQALSELSSEDIEQGRELDPNANIILQYDQGTVDAIEQVLRDAKEAGSEFNEEVIKPVVDVIQEAGYAVDDYILQPIKEGIMSIWDMLPSLPETKDVGLEIKGPDIDLPSISGIDIDIPKPEFRGSKPFGEDLKAFRPLTAPQMGQQAPLLPKVDVQGFDPRKTGSPIVASLFSEYLG